MSALSSVGDSVSRLMVMMVLFGSGSETRVYPNGYEFAYKWEGNAPTHRLLASPIEWLHAVVKVGAVSVFLRDIPCAPLDLIA